MSMLSSLNDPQRPESLHTADSFTEVTAVESMGSGSTQIVAPEDNSSLNDGTGLNSLVNGSARNHKRGGVDILSSITY